MKCTINVTVHNSLKRVHAAFLCCVLLLTGCAQTGKSLVLPYDTEQDGRSFSYEDVVPLFSGDLCVVSGDIQDGSVELSEEESAGLFDLTRGETLYAHRVHARMDPASMTKIMTALVAVETGSLDQKLVCKNKNYITEHGAQLLDMEQGEQMTLHQALHFLLVYSANDVAMMIADNVCENVEAFVAKMNEKALALGATNCHFSNPHGLTEPDQYVSAYDMYLIFNAAMQYEVLRRIVSQPSYKTQYYRPDGTLKEAEVMCTNAFLRENSKVSAPAGVTVIGGKTGSTFAAGECLVLLVNDVNGNPYVAVLMHAPDSASLYRKMTSLLEKAVS